MKNYSVRLYQKNDFDLWNSFVEQAKNATFLFHRNFMDYHSSRFNDFSLLVFEGNKLVAIVPANRVDANVFSHQGLTYGGLVLNQQAKMISILSIFRSILVFLQSCQVEKFIIKTIPTFYCNSFCDELHYVLFLTQSVRLESNICSVLNLKDSLNFSKKRLNEIKKGVQNNLIIVEEVDFELFWNEILIPNLEQKHQSKPVHSLAEIRQLKSFFPNQIRQFNVYKNQILQGGTTVFVLKNGVHSQYISANDTKNQTGCLDFLHHYLITDKFKNLDFFDFGTSNEHNGTKINEGLLYWKQSFGAQIVTQDFYEVQTKNHILLNNVLI